MGIEPTLFGFAIPLVLLVLNGIYVLRRELIRRRKKNITGTPYWKGVNKMVVALAPAYLGLSLVVLAQVVINMDWTFSGLFAALMFVFGYQILLWGAGIRHEIFGNVTDSDSVRVGRDKRLINGAN